MIHTTTNRSVEDYSSRWSGCSGQLFSTFDLVDRPRSEPSITVHCFSPFRVTSLRFRERCSQKCHQTDIGVPYEDQLSSNDYSEKINSWQLSLPTGFADLDDMVMSKACDEVTRKWTLSPQLCCEPDVVNGNRSLLHSKNSVGDASMIKQSDSTDGFVKSSVEPFPILEPCSSESVRQLDVVGTHDVTNSVEQHTTQTAAADKPTGSVISQPFIPTGYANSTGGMERTPDQTAKAAADTTKRRPVVREPIKFQSEEFKVHLYRDDPVVSHILRVIQGGLEASRRRAEAAIQGPSRKDSDICLPYCFPLNSFCLIDQTSSYISNHGKKYHSLSNISKAPNPSPPAPQSPEGLGEGSFSLDLNAAGDLSISLESKQPLPFMYKKELIARYEKTRPVPELTEDEDVIVVPCKLKESGDTPRTASFMTVMSSNTSPSCAYPPFKSGLPRPDRKTRKSFLPRFSSWTTSSVYSGWPPTSDEVPKSEVQTCMDQPLDPEDENATPQNRIFNLKRIPESKGRPQTYSNVEVHPPELTDSTNAGMNTYAQPTSNFHFNSIDAQSNQSGIPLDRTNCVAGWTWEGTNSAFSIANHAETFIPPKVISARTSRTLYLPKWPGAQCPLQTQNSQPVATVRTSPSFNCGSVLSSGMGVRMDQDQIHENSCTSNFICPCSPKSEPTDLSISASRLTNRIGNNMPMGSHSDPHSLNKIDSVFNSAKCPISSQAVFQLSDSSSCRMRSSEPPAVFRSIFPDPPEELTNSTLITAVVSNSSVAVTAVTSFTWPIHSVADSKTTDPIGDQNSEGLPYDLSTGNHGKGRDWSATKRAALNWSSSKNSPNNKNVENTRNGNQNAVGNAVRLDSYSSAKFCSDKEVLRGFWPNLDKSSSGSVRSENRGLTTLPLNLIFQSNHAFQVNSTGQQSTCLPDMPKLFPGGLTDNISHIRSAESSTHTKSTVTSLCSSSNETDPININNKSSNNKKSTTGRVAGGGGLNGSSGLRTKSKFSVGSHVCPDCFRKFTRSDMLVRHKHVHTGDRPFVCNDCGQKFSRSDHLSTHRRTHTGQRPYSCEHCDYSACRRDMITRHMRVHQKRPMQSQLRYKRSLTADPEQTDALPLKLSVMGTRDKSLFPRSLVLIPRGRQSRPTQSTQCTETDQEMAEVSSNGTQPITSATLPHSRMVCAGAQVTADKEVPPLTRT
ncbi:Early growth response protein 1 [Fasciola hepatica]|uniref:Early growth response protein 1 n=1 Tax=Fasciola hepatica TaxID=6192 RepID=A0A4E0RI80_FASHE|nr:Early growth response protein 1 [Fasciola hepatica]